MNTDRRADLLYAATLLAIVVACYARILAYPHIQDDWRAIQYLTGHPSYSDMFRELVSPVGHLFFRPLSRLYHVFSYEVFGLHASAFHVLAMLWLWAGAWLASRVLHCLTGDLLLARAVGILYAAATSIHMDPMLWEAGINELAGAFFVLLSFLFFLKGKDIASAAACLTALLFKESCIFLPVILALVGLRRMGPFAVMLAAYAIPKSLNQSIAGLPDTHPYVLRMSLASMLTNTCSYLKWTADALFPYLAEAGWKNDFFLWLNGHPVVIAGMCVLAVAPFVFCRRHALLVAWAGLGLAPVLLLPNHCYRYYLTYSLPPLLALFLLGVRGCVRNSRYASTLLVVLVAMNVFFSWRYFARREADGFGTQFKDGTNELLARGRTVNVVRSSLAALHPQLPRGSFLIFDGVDLYSFNSYTGPRVWYGDDTLQVMRLDHVMANRKGDWIQGPGYGALEQLGYPTSSLVHIARGTTFAFRLEQGNLRDTTEEFFSSIGL